MSCKLTPWSAAAVRNLSIRTRRPATPALRAARLEQRPIRQAPFLITKRGLADDITSREPPPENHEPPPESGSPPESKELEHTKSIEVFAPNFLNAEALAALEKAAAGQDIYGEGEEGLLFGMPERVGKTNQLQDRYHPVVDQITKLLMKDGKLSRAQRVRYSQVERRKRQQANQPLRRT